MSKHSSIALALGIILLAGAVPFQAAIADSLPSGTTITTGPYPSGGDIHVVVLSSPGAQTINFPSPSGPVEKLFSTVTSYVSGAVLYFDIEGTTYSKSISPNSNTLMKFSSPVAIANVRMIVQDRGYPDDAVHAGYFYQTSSQSSGQSTTPSNSLPSGTTVSTGSYPTDFQIQVVVLSDPNLKTVNFQTPQTSVTKLFSTVTSYVQGATLYFDSGGTTYSLSISPNSNTIMTFSNALNISKVRMTIMSRGYPDDAVHFGYYATQSPSPPTQPSDALPSGATKTTSSSYPADFQTQVVVLSDPNLKTINFQSPGNQVTKIFSTVTTYVQNAVLYFDNAGTTYSVKISPNSNTVITFSTSLSVSNVRVKIDGRGYADDAVHFGYYTGQTSPPQSSSPAEVLPSGASKTTGSSYPNDFKTQVIVLSDPNLKTINFQSPTENITMLFSTVTTYVQSAVLYFDSGGKTYAVNITPNSNTIVVFSSPISLSNVKMTIQGRGYPDDAVHFGYYIPQSTIPTSSPASGLLPSGASKTAGNAYPTNFETQVVVLADPNLKTINFKNPSDKITKLFSTVTTYVKSPVLYFDYAGKTYSTTISPNSNTIISFSSPLAASNIRIIIDGRGYPDDAVHIGYFYGGSTVQQNGEVSFAIRDIQNNKAHGASFVPDEKISLYALIENTGGVPIDTICLTAMIDAKDSGGGIYLSGDGANLSPIMPGSTRLIGFDSNVPAFMKGWFSLDATVTLSDSLLCGGTKIVKTMQKTDSFVVGSVGEAAQGTQPVSEEGQLDVGVAKPDLYVIGLSWSPTSPTAGDKVTFHYNVVNKGGGSAGAHKISLMVDNVITRISEIGSLAGSSSASGSFASWICDDKVHSIKIISDSENSLSESDESNNTWTEQFACMTVTMTTETAKELEPRLAFQISTNTIKADIWDYKASLVDEYLITFSRPDKVAERFSNNLYTRGQELAQEGARASLDESDQILFILQSVQFSFDALKNSRANWEIASKLMNNDPALNSVVSSLQDLKQECQNIARYYREGHAELAESREILVPGKVSKVVSSLDTLYNSVKAKGPYQEKVSWSETVVKGQTISKDFVLSGNLKNLSFVLKQSPQSDFWTFHGSKYSAYFLTERRDQKMYFETSNLDSSTYKAPFNTLGYPYINRIWIDITPVDLGKQGWFLSTRDISSAKLDIQITLGYDDPLDKKWLDAEFRTIIGNIKSALRSF